MLEQLGHRGLVGFLMLSGVLMAIAMIPLIILILAGIALYSLTTRHTPRELTRRAALGPTR
jgi:hypothetical protein